MEERETQSDHSVPSTRATPDESTLPTDAENVVEIPFPNAGPNRIEANTALLRLSDVAGVDPNITPIPTEDGEEEGGEAASARIAQEYRRQVRIKRLAEEIQVAEREKKEEEKRRKAEAERIAEAEAQLAKPPSSKETPPSLLAVAPSSARRTTHLRDKGMRPPTPSVFIKKPTAKNHPLVVAGVALSMLGLLAGATMATIWAVGVFLPSRPASTAKASAPTLTPAATALIEKLQKDEEAAKQRAAAPVAPVVDERKKQMDETAALQRKLDDERKEREAQTKKVQEVEAVRAAEEKRFHEENQRLLDEQKKAAAELQQKIEEASRGAREKMKAEQDEAAKLVAAKEKQDAAPPVEKAADPVEKPVATAAPKTVPATTSRPEFVGNEPLKVSPPPAPPVPGLPEVPSGGVRLSVKASDPYNGKLTFRWNQLKGSKVEIADPTAAIFRDGKWYSQTYFMAHEPGTYEFEITVKNEDGVETRKQFPIEVLPPALLK